MADPVQCPSCGGLSAIPSCSACGAPSFAGVLGDGRSLDRDQAASEHDQTASDEDQTWADHDQTASDRDQLSANEDQAAADEDLAAGGDADVHRRSALARERTARDRLAVASERDETAGRRLEAAADRDLAAERRDRTAEERDQAAARRDASARADLDRGGNASRHEFVLRAERDRARAAADRANAREDRFRAADDRAQSARDRMHALLLQAEAAETVRSAATDLLTGASTRRAGLAQVWRELERAARTGGSLALAFVDVDDLKRVNDSGGHTAGDQLLRRVGELVRANLRSYDVFVRYGGDEFVCAMPNVSAGDARLRFAKIAAQVKASSALGHSISFGLASAEPAETVDGLIDRADRDLLEARASRRDT